MMCNKRGVMSASTLAPWQSTSKLPVERKTCTANGDGQTLRLEDARSRLADPVNCTTPCSHATAAEPLVKNGSAATALALLHAVLLYTVKDSTSPRTAIDAKAKMAKMTAWVAIKCISVCCCSRAAPPTCQGKTDKPEHTATAEAETLLDHNAATPAGRDGRSELKLEDGSSPSESQGGPDV